MTKRLNKTLIALILVVAQFAPLADINAADANGANATAVSPDVSAQDNLDTMAETAASDASTIPVETEILANENGDEKITITRGETTIADFPQVLAIVPANQDLVVSTDSLAVADELAAKTEREGPKATGLRRLVPLGKRFTSYIVNGFRSNPIGFVVVTFTTGIDSFTWIHSTQFSPEVRAMESIYSFLFALTFSVETGTWLRHAANLHGKFMNFFRIDKATSPRLARWGFIATNWGMNFVNQVLRFSIIAIDQFHQPGFKLKAAATIAVLSFAQTYSSLAWNEHDQNEKTERMPFARFVAYRLGNLRSFFMGKFAPSSYLMQPKEHGFLPWVVLTIVGALGMIANKHRDRIANWLEDLSFKNPRLRKTVLIWRKGADASLDAVEGRKARATIGLGPESSRLSTTEKCDEIMK